MKLKGADVNVELVMDVKNRQLKFFGRMIKKDDIAKFNSDW